MKPLSRRSVIAGSAAAVTALPALALPVAATQGGDAELRQLWVEYLKEMEALDRAREAHSPARAAYYEEWDACRDEVLNADPPLNLGKIHDEMWARHDMERTYRHVRRQFNRVGKVAKAIRRAKAQTLFGIGVKLSVAEDPSDPWWEEAIDDARRSIGLLTGTDFIAATGPALET